MTFFNLLGVVWPVFSLFRLKLIANYFLPIKYKQKHKYAELSRTKTSNLIPDSGFFPLFFPEAMN